MLQLHAALLSCSILRNLADRGDVCSTYSCLLALSSSLASAVFMGMGEPLLNIPAVVAAATYMREQMGMSGRSITISTVGVPNAMRKLAQYQLTATLAVSIHAPNQELREQLIPSAKVYPLQVRKISACSYGFAVSCPWYGASEVCPMIGNKTNGRSCPRVAPSISLRCSPRLMQHTCGYE